MLTIALVLMQAAGQPSKTDAVKTELRALMTDLTAALAARDRAALERIYADEFLFVHALGPPADKKAQIDGSMTSAGGAIPMPSFDNLLVYGNVAILRQPVEGRFGTTIYAKKNGRWQIVQLQGTPTPLTRRSASVAEDVLRSYAGRYQQDNGLFVTIGVANGELTLQVDGRQRLTLAADSDTKFILPGGAGTITFAKTADGVTYQVVRGSGQIVNGVREK